MRNAGVVSGGKERRSPVDADDLISNIWPGYEWIAEERKDLVDSDDLVANISSVKQ